MKIGLVTISASRKAGGLLSSTMSLAKNLNKFKDIEFFVFALNDEFSASDLPSWQPIIPSFFAVFGPKSFGYSLQLKRALNLQNPDIFHLHGLWTYPSIAVNRCARKKRKPYLVSPHGMLDPWAISNSILKKKIAGFLYENRTLNNAACIHSLSDAETMAMRSYGFKNPVCVIPNGINIPLKNLEYKKPNWINNKMEGKKILLYLGRIHPQKGLKNLIQAWSEIYSNNKKTASEWVLVIAGWDQGGHEFELKDQVKELNVNHQVFFIGPQFEELKAICYYHADAFILPSLSEGLPMVILEAWAYSLPVIMTSHCNIPEGFISGAAINIEPNSESIKKNLLKFLEMSESDRVTIGKNGFSLVSRKFTWEIVASDMKSVYDWVLGGGYPPSSVSLK